MVIDPTLNYGGQQVPATDVMPNTTALMGMTGGMPSYNNGGVVDPYDVYRSRRFFEIATGKPQEQAMAKATQTSVYQDPETQQIMNDLRSQGIDDASAMAIARREVNRRRGYLSSEALSGATPGIDKTMQAAGEQAGTRSYVAGDATPQARALMPYVSGLTTPYNGQMTVATTNGPMPVQFTDTVAKDPMAAINFMAAGAGDLRKDANADRTGATKFEQDLGKSRVNNQAGQLKQQMADATRVNIAENNALSAYEREMFKQGAIDDRQKQAAADKLKAEEAKAARSKALKGIKSADYANYREEWMNSPYLQKQFPEVEDYMTNRHKLKSDPKLSSTKIPADVAAGLK